MVNKLRGGCMKKRFIFIALLLAVLSLSLSSSQALAQDYYFHLTQKIVHVYWNADGSMALDFTLNFSNYPSGHSIEYVDVGMPNDSYDISTVTAEVNGKSVYEFSTSGYQGSGSGFAVGLGTNSILPGKSGVVHIYVGRISNVLYNDSQDNNYASADYIPFWFDSAYVNGSVDTTVIFHLPPGIKPEEPRWHSAPSGFSSEPSTGIDENGRITYTWHNTSATASDEYLFGASFPKVYVPADTIQRENPFAWLNKINLSGLLPLACIGSVIFFIYLGVQSDNRRRKEYLPPSIKIEGHGIKRGLTAIEAAILLEEPFDKIMTMMLFSVIKKGAAKVTRRDPLTVEAINPQPEGLRPYEIDFLQAIIQPNQSDVEKSLRKMMVALINSTAANMKGFSRNETINYYKGITAQAWQQVEQAGTPEFKSQKFDEVMEWTMLDRNYDDKTKQVFHDVPVFLPRWWGWYDPGYGTHTTLSPSIPTSSSSQGSIGMPNVPGSQFASSVVNQVQAFSGKVVSNISSFTNSVTNVTNPPPVSTSSSSSYRGGGGGHSCACACACAGCACACAGGGR